VIESPFHSEPAAAALGWIDRIIEDLGDGAEDLELALSVEVCAVICADSASSLSPLARALVARARTIAAGAFDRLGGRAFDLPGLLLLLAAVAEQAVCGEPAPPLVEYAEAAAVTLCTPRATAELPGYLAPRLLLSRLGLASDRCVAESLLPSRLGRLLLSQPARLAGGLDRIEAACRYGLHPVLGPRSLRRALGAILLCRLQDYDLETACRILRALTYLGEGETTSLIAQGSHFLLAQQNEEGGFGFLENECASLARRFPGTRTDLRFRLGITTCVLWTLAECSGNGYRLLRDLGRGLTGSRPAGRSMACLQEIV
jgi:hypothetical protein